MTVAGRHVLTNIDAKGVLDEDEERSRSNINASVKTETELTDQSQL